MEHRLENTSNLDKSKIISRVWFNHMTNKRDLEKKLDFEKLKVIENHTRDRNLLY